VFVRRGTEWSDGVEVCQTPNLVYCASGATSNLDSEIETGKYYYRLKQTDFDGHYSYSSKIILENCVKSPLTFELYPNPSNGTLYFSYSGDLSEFVSLKIVNAIGEDFKKFNSFQSEINLRTYPAGDYFFQIQFKDRTVVEKIIVLI
jgi:hypothetical protein